MAMLQVEKIRASEGIGAVGDAGKRFYDYS